MNYCSNCGNCVALMIPPGEDRPRFFCKSCGTIHYQNPKVVVGCIPEMDEKILLCRRAIEPCYGKWTLPAGYLENGETVMEGAKREAVEEACVNIEILSPYALFNIPGINQIYLLFRARLKDETFKPGTESIEVKLFTEEEIPWDQIAFKVVKATLKKYFNDRLKGLFPFQIDDIPMRKLTPQRT